MSITLKPIWGTPGVDSDHYPYVVKACFFRRLYSVSYCHEGQMRRMSLHFSREAALAEASRLKYEDILTVCD